MTMDASTGVAISNSLDVSNNLQVQGSLTVNGTDVMTNLNQRAWANDLVNGLAGKMDATPDLSLSTLSTSGNVLCGGLGVNVTAPETTAHIGASTHYAEVRV